MKWYTDQTDSHGSTQIISVLIRLIRPIRVPFPERSGYHSRNGMQLLKMIFHICPACCLWIFLSCSEGQREGKPVETAGSYDIGREREYRGIFGRGSDAQPIDRFYSCDSVAADAERNQALNGFPSHITSVNSIVVLEFSDRVDRTLYDSLVAYTREQTYQMCFLRCKGVIFDTIAWGMVSERPVLHITEILEMRVPAKAECPGIK